MLFRQFFFAFIWVMAGFLASEACHILFLASSLGLFLVFRHSRKSHSIFRFIMHGTPSLVIGHPLSSLHTSLTLFRTGSFFWSMAFSMSLMIFPYWWLSAIYRNHIAKYSSAAYSFATFNCSPDGFFMTSLFRTALTPCSVWPMHSPSWSHTCHMAVNWSQQWLAPLLPHLKQVEYRHFLVMHHVWLFTAIWVHKLFDQL